MKLARKNSERSCADGALSFKLMALMTVLFGALALTLQAAQPSWWTTVLNSNPRNDSAAVNESQVKLFTEKAVAQMNAHLSGGAGTTLNSLVTGWTNDYQTHGYSATSPKPSDLQAMRVGQLKYIADKIYTPLISAGYMLATPIWLHTNAVVDSNLATAGQLKEVFSFEIATPQTPIIATVVKGSTFATLSWSDPVVSIQHFTIQGSTNGGTTWVNLTTTISGTLNTVTVTGLTLGANYIFRMTASNVAGTSSASTTDASPIITLTTPTATLVP